MSSATIQSLPDPGLSRLPGDLSLDVDQFDDAATRAHLQSYLAGLFRPPVQQSLSEWAEANITLSSEYAARSSHLRLFSWQKQIFDAFTDPAIHTIVLDIGVQLSKTLFIQCAFAYVACHDPGPILLIEPKEDDARAFSKERLQPMIRDNVCLRGIVSESARDGTNTLLTKSFPGGSLSLVGAIAPGNLARRSIRFLFCDEIDKYPVSAGKEGDPIDLARERTSTFGSRKKVVLCCSPTLAGSSRIGKAYRSGDQRRPYVPCPACQTLQVLRWQQVKWDSSVAAELQPATAYYECINPACQAHWTDIQRQNLCNNQAVFQAEKPGNGIASFWISHLYSPWKKLSEIVEHFLRVKNDRQMLQVFVNTVLAEEWMEQGETPDDEALYARREPYRFGDDAVVPQRGLFLTAAVDVQDNPPRLECEVRAWGRGRENWSIDYRVIQAFAENGQPLPVTSRELWDKLDSEVLQRAYAHESGHTLSVLAMCIDTGNRPKPVYDFARRHPQLSFGPAGVRLHSARTVIPVKGTDDPLRIIHNHSKEDASRKRQGVRIIAIGTHCAKQEIFDLLQHVRPRADGSPTPGCYHFPMYNLSYFTGLCAERRVVHPDSGDVTYEKIPGRERNEPLDLAVYNRAAATLFGIDRFSEAQWQQLEHAVAPMNKSVIDSSNTTVPLRGAAGTTHELPPAANLASSSSSPSPTPAPPPTSPGGGIRPVRPQNVRRSIRGTFL